MHGRPSDASMFIPNKAQATFNVSAANSTLIMKTLTGAASNEVYYGRPSC